MNALLTIFTFFLASVSASPTATPTALTDGSYIIRFKSHTGLNSFSSVLNRHQTSSFGPNPNNVKHTYTLFPGVGGTFSAEFLNELQTQHAHEIAYIEKSGHVRALGTQNNPPSWGLSRVSQRQLSRGAPYLYPDSAGSGVDVYIIDTGVQASHSDFGGRAQMVKSFVKNEDAVDMNGHGTHCSGTIASATYGVAKQANIKGVKVLNATGDGEDMDVVAALDWVGTQSFTPFKTVVSMSIGGDNLQAITDAVDAAFHKGIVSVVAAGNDADDACKGSPASAPNAITVGATSSTDAKASYSNIGKCVDIFAPGSAIKSLWLGADGATNTISGTSMATPHVSGIVALFMAQKNYTSSQAVVDDIISAGTKGVVKGLDATTVNLLAYNSFATSDQ